jgi:excisionase family DNA binding protein
LTSNLENLLEKILSEIRSANKQYTVWLTIEELSSYIGLKVSTIYQYVNRDRIPYMKIPGSNKLIFRRKDIDAWISLGNHSRIEKEKARLESSRIWSKIHKGE